MTTLYKNKKIVFFTAETVPSFAGGGRNAFSTARFLSKNVAKTSVVCLNYNNKLISTEKKDGVHIKRIAYFNNNMLAKLFSIPILLFNYSVAVFKYDIVFVYGCYMPGYLWIMLWAWILQKCVIFRSTLLGDDDITSLKQKPLWFIKKFILNRINLYFAINKEFKSIWEEELGTRTSIFMSQQGIDSSIFNTSIRAKKLHIKNTVPVILTNSILIERKGHRQVFHQLSKMNLEFKYVVIGQYKPDAYHKSNKVEEAEMNELYSLGKELLGSRVEFVNTTDDITPYLAQADLFLYAGLQDGTPNAVLEAMAVGLPVLMYNTGVNKEFFQSGKTVETFNKFSELPTKLNAILSDTEKMNEIAKNASQTISNYYTFEQVVNSLFDSLNCKNNKKY